MSIRHTCRTVLLCIALGIGSLIGVPTRPEEIQELMQTMNQPKIAHTLPQENENDEDVDTET
jgi:hypothetical protein